jgi:hypothetical protein
MHYAVCYRNGAGHIQRSEYTRFKTDADALSYGRRGCREAAVVEVWKGNDLLARLQACDRPPLRHDAEGDDQTQ